MGLTCCGCTSICLRCCSLLLWVGARVTVFIPLVVITSGPMSALLIRFPYFPGSFNTSLHCPHFLVIKTSMAIFVLSIRKTESEGVEPKAHHWSIFQFRFLDVAHIPGVKNIPELFSQFQHAGFMWIGIGQPLGAIYSSKLTTCSLLSITIITMSASTFTVTTIHVIGIIIHILLLLLFHHSSNPCWYLRVVLPLLDLFKRDSEVKFICVYSLLVSTGTRVKEYMEPPVDSV